MVRFRFSSASRRLRFFRTVTVLFAILAASLCAQAAAPVDYALCDVRVMYLFDEPGSIDWPTIYYLNDVFGCRIDMVTARERSRTEVSTREVTLKELYLHTVYMSESDSAAAGTAVAMLFGERQPDIVLHGDLRHNPRMELLRNKIYQLAEPGQRMFNILKIYRRVDEFDQSGSAAFVALNGRELFRRYRDRMTLEVPVLLPGYDVSNYQGERLVRYAVVKSNLGHTGREDNFLAGMSSFRLTEFIDSLFPEGPMKLTLLKQARQYISYFNASRMSVGQKRAGFIVDGYRELGLLTTHERLIEEYPDYQRYLERLLSRAERAALNAVGISWDGKVALRDSPHGPRLKFVVSISADGPKEVEVNTVRFQPYWDSTIVVLDSFPRVILPHQAYAKEFLVEIENSYLDAEVPDSLVFSVEVAYGKIPLVFTSSLPVWEAPALTITFQPDYQFVKPFPGLDIDRVVSSTTIKALITKPYDYSGAVEINLTTPRGMFAGAYRKDLQLEKGMLTESVRIPFTISNLFELGIQMQTIELLEDKRVVAADTGRIRIASCEIPDTVKVAFLPDSLGMLEDILRMTECTFRPFTDRSLMTADFDAYNVIVVGSGCFRNHPSLRLMKGRFEEYLRQGGSLVILGQPEDWPGDVLPVSFVPKTEVVEQSEIDNRINEARILAVPYSISDKNLLSSFYSKREVAAAVISPSERVFVTPTGAALLSVTRLGEGQIIFCGLPLMEMIARLDIDAIHLFANILNY